MSACANILMSYNVSSGDIKRNPLTDIKVLRNVSSTLDYIRVYSPSFSGLRPRGMMYNSSTNSWTGATMEDDKMIKNYNKLDSFYKLPDNWDGHGAAAVPELVLDRMNSLLSRLEFQPEIFPTTYGSIQFEYEKDNGEYLEFEMFVDHVKVFSIDENNNEAGCKIDIEDTNKINRMVKEFHGR